MATLPTDADTTPNYTAAQHATHHNTLHGLWNKLTTKGDLLVATAAQAYSRLAVGTNGQVLTADSTVTEGVKWATPSGTSVVRAQARRSTTQSISNGTWTLVTFDTEDLDTDTMFTTASGDRFTCKTAGRFQIRFQTEFATNGTGIRAWLICKSASAATNQIAKVVRASGTGAAGAADECTCEVDLVVNDIFTCQVYQDSGGALNIAADSGTNIGTRCQVRRVSD